MHALAGDFGILVYSDQGESLTITGLRMPPTEPVVIPAEIDGKPVTAIGNNAFLGSSLMAVTIPESVTSIAWGAFSSCNNLVSVTIPGGVTSFGDYAFSDCENLKQVTISEGVKSIGPLMFWRCANLELVTLPEGLTSIGNDAFNGCGKLAKVTLPSSLTSIGLSAFADCAGLKEVAIPGSVKSIGGAAFIYCRGLQTLAIGEGVTEIGGNAFSGCRSLRNVSIPGSVTLIGGSAFYKCSSLESVTIPDSVSEIGSGAFESCSGLTKLVIGGGLSAIKRSVFSKCVGLMSVTIPANVKSIDWLAFGYCPMLEEAIFLGDAPDTHESAFHAAGSEFRVRFYASRKGFTEPWWNGYPSNRIIVQPEIELHQPLGTMLTDGADLRWLGKREVGSKSEPMYFTIRNLGEKPLTGISMKVTGKHAEDFSIRGGGRISLAAGESMKFQVLFKPRATGIRNAVLRVLSNDANESPFKVKLQGEGRGRRGTSLRVWD